jgi:CRISPR-associated protein Csb1
MPLSYSALVQAVADDSAFRRRRRLQPVGGPGDKLYPPTYPGEGKSPPRHVFERRRVDGREAWCVLIDSVQSQANRLEEALLEAARAGHIPLPRLSVDFAVAGLNSIGEITTLDAPHRVFDAILRDSLLDGVPFSKSPLGDRLRKATAKDATAILEASPSALLFGVWNSTGEGGGLGAKFPRAIVSEIIGVDVPVEDAPADTRTGEVEVRTAGRRTGSRIDPLGVLSVVEVYKSKDGWDVTEKGAGKGAKKVRPSEINHGNIRPEVTPLGVTCAYAEHTAVITLAGLRRLRFGGAAERDVAGRALIAALGLVALTEQDVQGYALRSRCDLVCEGPAPLEKVAFDGTVEQVALSREEARALYEAAFTAARQAGFALNGDPVRLTPQDKLVHLVRESMNRALNDEGGEGGDA